jgi:hypothetical protein
MVTRTRVFEYQSGQVVSDSSEQPAVLTGDLLTVNECTRPGAMCAVPGGLVLKFAADSLVQQIPEGISVPARVYSLVSGP